MPDEPYSEADARRELIDRNLRLAGWNVDDPSQVSTELDIYLEGGSIGAVRERAREEYTGHQFADYALQLTGRPAAVVEAKKTSRDARVGQEQARQYADNIHRILGGQKPFVMYTNGHDTYFRDSELYPPAKVFGFPTPLDLEWLAQKRETRGPL